MDLKKLLQEKREDILKLAKKHGAYNIRIFGSVARGEADEKSDLDILINMESGRSLLDRVGLILDLESLLGCRVDVVTERGLGERVRDRILKEAMPL